MCLATVGTEQKLLSESRTPKSEHDRCFSVFKKLCRVMQIHSKLSACHLQRKAKKEIWKRHVGELPTGFLFCR